MLDEIADALWGDNPPASYRKIVQGCVVRLRRELGDDAITTLPGGYSLASDDTDAACFAQLINSAQDSDDPRHTFAVASNALTLWRGDPFPELAEWPPAWAEMRRLSELREVAEDLQVEAEFLSGRVKEAAANARVLASATPYRESRWGLLARAQYAAGRQADALETIHSLRATLVDDLGIDPSPEIAALETAILRQDPSLAVPSTVGSGRWIFSRAGRIVAATLAIATATGVGLAVHQRQQADRADEAATSARSTTEALRLGELAATIEDPSVAFALAAESLATDDTEAVRVRALETFGNFVDLLSTGVPPDSPWPEARFVATSPDGRTVAVAHDAAIQLTFDGHETRRLATPSNDPTALAFSPDGRYLAAGMSEIGFAPTGATVVWNVTTGTQVARFDSGNGAVHAHVWAPDGSSIWSLGDDGIHQWDLTASHALARTAEGGPVMFRAGEVVIAIGDPSVDAWIDYACALAGRPLTPVEWRKYAGDRPYAPTCR